MEKTLKHQPLNKELAPGVKQIQNIRQSNSALSYIEFQILELEKGASYKETGSQQEVCIVILTGKIKVKAADTWYEDLGTRESVFEKFQPTVFIFRRSIRLNLWQLQTMSDWRFAIHQRKKLCR